MEFVNDLNLDRVKAANESDDGTEQVSLEKEMRFVAWLEEHGANISSMDWPSRQTVSGVRGVLAKKDIQPNEPMFEIPLKLMIYPQVCFDCPELADVYALNKRFFASDDDLVIALFLMHEKLQGEKSFYHPYIDILPRPGGIGDWTPEEQMELQDRSLIGEARRRRIQHQRLYERLFAILQQVDAQRFPPEDYSLELFTWAWMIIQSRAFGKRLAWTALVPFADLLNHQNVQTKYALSRIKQDATIRSNEEQAETKSSEPGIDSQLAFQLFPTGSNHYKAGEEAFNSYGRRSNRFLLLEYGFCLENNEWATFDVCARLETQASLYKEKCELLRSLSVGTVKLFKLRKAALNVELLGFLRVAVMEDSKVIELCQASANERQSSDPVRACEELRRVWHAPVSEHHEHSVVEAYRDLVNKEIANLETSLEHDEALLHSKDIPIRKRIALTYTVTRKRILVAQLDLLHRYQHSFKC